MPEFILDTSGHVAAANGDVAIIQWKQLDAFTQGYIEALFFTENEPGTDRLTRLADLERWREGVERGEHKDIPGDYGFADLAPEALARIIDDCAKFQTGGPLESFIVASNAGAAILERGSTDIEAEAGRDFWFTRNGHGTGFWDGDWPEPYATELTEAAEAFGGVDDVYLGDDGKVHLS